MFQGKRLKFALGVLVVLSLLAGMIAGLTAGSPGVTAAGQSDSAGVAPAAQTTHPEVLVLQVYFKDTAERDRLATELGAAEVATGGGFLTVWTNRATYNSLVARGLRVEIDQETTKQANNPNLFGNTPNTFFGGYRTVEEMQTLLNQM